MGKASKYDPLVEETELLSANCTRPHSIQEWNTASTGHPALTEQDLVAEVLNNHRNELPEIGNSQKVVKDNLHFLMDNPNLYQEQPGLNPLNEPFPRGGQRKFINAKGSWITTASL